MQVIENLLMDSFTNVDVSQLNIPMIVIYNSPKDIPGKYVARLYDVDQPTNITMIKETLAELHEALPPNVHHVPRNANDHPTIVETWLY
ncbi:hypothetical protein A374_15868 [Fictibacillus macauensis ZFHKF-1]|uniref:Uncharacterized protein n=1 Tax=Fictibacillus macauensis ZFHKF-1 TaxID=1196324 RepID=I8UBV7_9BACL|nr:hypothetical protein [Fictibacillus macauensis]EIT84278.1 hypothetical protein A374_15868 [Fictibacillus macauensis ZFHKF-1]